MKRSASAQPLKRSASVQPLSAHARAAVMPGQSRGRPSSAASASSTQKGRTVSVDRGDSRKLLAGGGGSAQRAAAAGTLRASGGAALRESSRDGRGSGSARAMTAPFGGGESDEAGGGGAAGIRCGAELERLGPVPCLTRYAQLQAAVGGGVCTDRVSAHVGAAVCARAGVCPVNLASRAAVRAANCASLSVADTGARACVRIRHSSVARARVHFG